MTDARGPEAGAGTVRCARVEGGAEEGNVELFRVRGQAGEVWEAAEGGDAGEDGVGLVGGWVNVRRMDGEGWMRISYLSSTVTGNGVVPEALLVRALSSQEHGRVTCMFVAENRADHGGGEEEEGGGREHHVRVFSGQSQEQLKGKKSSECSVMQ